MMPFFRKPTLKQLALRELEEAERLLLQAQSAVEYAKSIAAYNAARAKRLQEFLKESGQ